MSVDVTKFNDHTYERVQSYVGLVYMLYSCRVAMTLRSSCSSLLNVVDLNVLLYFGFRVMFWVHMLTPSPDSIHV